MTRPGQSELAEWVALAGRLLQEFVAAPENWRSRLLTLDALPIVRLPEVPAARRVDLKLLAFQAAARLALREYLRSGDFDALEMPDADTCFELHLRNAGGAVVTVEARMNSADPRTRLVLGIALAAADAAEAGSIKRFGTGSVTLRGLREVQNNARERALQQALDEGAQSLMEAYQLAGVSPAAGKRIRLRSARSSLK